MRFIVLVMAALVLTRALDETMCVVGVRLDTAIPEWLRLYAPFRDLDNESRFIEYKVVSVGVRRPRSDRRPESWRPQHGTIMPGESFRKDHG